MTTTTRTPSSTRLDHTRPARIARRSLFLAVCTVFALFAIMLGVAEVLSWVGVVDAKPRAVPIAFVLHALAGGVCLLAGGLQFSTRLRARRPAVHRLVGRTYVSAVWIASTTGLGSALFFDVGPVARAGFVAATILWFTTTTIGLVLIRRGQVRRHREWMIRSFALSLFFVTGEPWTTALRASGLPEPVAFPAGMITAWSVNLLAAEARIRATRRRPRQRTTRDGPAGRCSDRGTRISDQPEKSTTCGLKVKPLDTPRGDVRPLPGAAAGGTLGVW